MTATRRIGATSSKTRALLLDAAEQLLLREGYAAVTSRRVAAEAGIKPQLVHYYFRAMDDLFLEVYRRRADEAIDRFAAAVAEHPTLRTVWKFAADWRGAAFNIEFVALANHRKPIRDEIAQHARRYRKLQLDAITAILDELGISPDACPPVVVMLAMNGVTQVMSLERRLGVTGGHRETTDFAETWIDEIERGVDQLPRASSASSRRKR
jgi:AcrR family transcriptional regulator